MQEEGAEDLLEEIGTLVEISRPDQAGDTLFYVEMGEGFHSRNIFDDFGDHVMMRRERDLMDDEEHLDLSDALYALWRLKPAGRRWAEMEYVIRGGRFEVRFVYEEEIERVLDEDGVPDSTGEFRRRDAIIARCLGAKPIRYPPWPGDDAAGQSFTLTPDA